MSTKPPVPSPIDHLRADRARAAVAGDPCANLLTLATVDSTSHELPHDSPHPRPRVRTLVLREIRESMLVVQISTTSPKWQQLQQLPDYEVLIHYPTVAVQYRLRGAGIVVLERDECAANWKRKGVEGRALDRLYDSIPQSTPLPNGYDLAKELAKQVADATHSDAARSDASRTSDRRAEPMPEHVVAVGFIPNEVERWEGARDQQGSVERLMFRLDQGVWRRQALMP